MSFVRNPGCASKIAPADLARVLGRLPPVEDSAVISGLAAGDDAAIYRLTDALSLVQTVDVFTPCVDDARLFGRICAANCLSDIYAMGGEPRTALSILAFPSETLPGEIMFEMLAGAMETFAEAGVALIGGHSIKDEEIKLGFAITGLIEPAQAAKLDAPCPGDVLVLTKPLGTGILAFARQIGREHATGLEAATRSMAALNRSAGEAMRRAGASLCTDVTGFGLFGHLSRMLRQHQLSAEIRAEALPAFPGVLDLLRQQVIPGAVERNREFVGNTLRVADGLDPAFAHLGLDAQTSGGLLIGIQPEKLEGLLARLAACSVSASVIGRIVAGPEAQISLGHGKVSPTRSRMPAPESHEQPQTPQEPRPGVRERAATDYPSALMKSDPTQTPHEPGCCADVSTQPQKADRSDSPQQAFASFMGVVQEGGAIDARTKELILFSLVVHGRCHPCFSAHYRKARSMGISQAELDEAAWCAIAMGGAPVKMFYQECLAAAQKSA
jgi:selenide,water dikinase